MSVAQTTPVRRPRLVRSVAYWVLVLASVASLALGVLLTVPNIGVMTSSLLDGSATGVEVYSGQAWVTLGAALAGAGVLGILFALALAAAASLIPRAVVTETAPEVVAEPESEAADVDLATTGARD
ncbi:dinucleotide-utilizing enzyme [Microbacterium paludicola]|uniref:dinucleotide-utilizing enzyme n=1 Tax=Microbacterium paludicola TaxID=300019 RepID=UPI0031DF57AF